jgi:hypothetical protein
MAMPRTALTALVVAIYAALISTITGIVQVFNYRRDRAHIVLKVGHDMVITTVPVRKGLTIVNAGPADWFTRRSQPQCRTWSDRSYS